jgi:hypothetical protein
VIVPLPMLTARSQRQVHCQVRLEDYRQAVGSTDKQPHDAADGEETHDAIVTRNSQKLADPTA